MMAYQALRIELEVVVVKVHGCQINKKDEELAKGRWEQRSHRLVDSERKKSAVC